MHKVKRCVQCGILKEEEEFRQYTYSKQNKTPGRYRICKACEAINANYRRAIDFINNLDNKQANPTLFNKNLEMVAKIEQLYKILELRGLRVPTASEYKEENLVDKLLAFYEESTSNGAPASNLSSSVIQATLPDELNEWLTIDKSVWREAGISPEYLQETVYESLKAKYRPQIGVNKETFLPIYDDTYKEVLNNILRRFDEYEEECSLIEEEDENV